LFDLGRLVAMNRIEADLIERAGDADVAHARNAVLHAFRVHPSRPQRLLLLDADVGVPPAAFAALLTCSEDFVVANYPWRDGSDRTACTAKSDRPMNGPLAAAKNAGLGCALLTRDCVNRMAAAAEMYRPYGMPYGEEPARAICVPGVRNGVWEAEDQSLVRAWERAGGTVWIHTGARGLTHTGPREHRMADRAVASIDGPSGGPAWLNAVAEGRP